MTAKQEGLIQKELDKIFAESKTAHDIGKLIALFTAEQQIKIYQLIADAKADFPFNVYFDNNVGGASSFSFNKPGGDEITDVTEITKGVAEWLEKWFYGEQEKNGLYCVNRNIAPTPK